MNKDEIKAKFSENMRIAKKMLVGLVIFVVVFFVLIGVLRSKNQKDIVSNTTTQITETVKFEYEEIARTKDNQQEDISILVKQGEPNPEAIALDIKKSCKKYCNISLYDDKKAYDLDKQYTDMTSSLNTKQEDLTKWKEANYIFVAEHLVATVGYGNTEGWGYGPFKLYPMKDWYYNERKGAK